MFVGSEDRDYREFLPVACRFEPKIADEKARSIIGGLLTRTGFPLRQVIINCVDHIPLVSSVLATQLIQRIAKSDIIGTLPEREQLVCRMFIFRYVVAQLSAQEQLDYMTIKLFGEGYLYSVIPSLKPQSTENIIKALHYALDTNDEDAAYLIIIAAIYGDTQTSLELEKIILCCFNAKSSKLRSAAYEFAVFRDLKTVRQLHVQSGWNAYSVDEKLHEDWFGSVLLVEACANGELPVSDLLTRINQRTWFVAAHRLGGGFAKPLAVCFIKHLRDGLKIIDEISLPAADLTISNEKLVHYPLISIDETERSEVRFPQPKSWSNMLEGSDFYAKQDSLKATVDVFSNELKKAKVQFLAQRFTIEDLTCLVDILPSLLSELTEILENARDSQFVWLKNLAFATANLISSDNPERAVTIFERAVASQGFLTQELGDGLTLEHSAIWQGKVSEPMKAFWRQRLLCSGNDEILFREILAAERFGASSFIKSLVNELVSSKDSLDLAYAISIAGYSKQSTELISVIEKHINDKRLLGVAAKYALASHETAQWAQYWTEKMWNAPTPEEFWRCLMIAKTCIDARVSEQPSSNTKWSHFTPIFQSVRTASIKEKNKERGKKFLGQEAPEKVFVLLSQ